MCKEAGLLQKLIGLCSRYGYIHPSCDLGRSGVKGCYDYGPLGTLLRRNIQNEWWTSVVSSQEDMFGIESSQLQQTSIRNTNQSENSSDDINDHRRLSVIPSSDEMQTQGENLNWTLRDSLNQGTISQYYNTLQLVSRRLPFGLAQIGQCFRRTGQSESLTDDDHDRYIFDLPEFTQMTAQFYCSPKTADRWMIDWQRDRIQWWRKRNYSKGSKLPQNKATCGNTRFPIQASLTLKPEFAECNAVTPLTEQEAVDLEQATVGQASCIHWFETREKRLTSSLFGKILKRKKAVNQSFLMSLFGFNSKADSSPAVMYGKNHEDEAKMVFAERNPHLHVHNCGFVVNPAFSFLGASPDGKVCDGGQTGILEVKCPYSARGMMVREAVASIPQFYMVKSTSDNSALALKRDHDYYYQVQGQLMVTGAPFCDFVVYTDRDVYVERILPDVELWNAMLDKLAAFYLKHAMPFLNEQGM
ncbi:uncharacterized protein LOC119734986 isoform X1 [Patiria miniata]|uniref:YqaJ viral recombinase domain-containing protein n=1 Tax=Patiria miniata TaxID=46514 RepID=A0A914AKQ7_PATMI|nr:uncharacterized protein LOC119734986 isoform X1 [Patiria miniata]